MAVHKKRQHLICYDIADQRRLATVHRFMTKRAIALQYSVFTALLNSLEVDKLLADLAELIDEHEDDIRIYPLPETRFVIELGRSGLAEGLSLLQDGRDISVLGVAA